MDRRSFLTLVGLAACERRTARSADAAAPAPPDVAPAETEEDFPPVAPPYDGLPDTALRPLGDATARLVTALWPVLRDGPGNPVWSPASVAVSLGLAAALARPEAAARTHAFLGLTGARADLDRAFATLLRQWHSTFEGTGFAALHRPFIARGAYLTDDARARLRTAYGAPAALVVADGNEGVRTRIHGFFSTRTHGAVAHLVALDGIVANVPANVVSVARAAVAVRGGRGAMRFRVGGVVPIDAPAIVAREGVSTARGTEATLVRVPLDDDNAALDLLVPDEGKRLDAVEPAHLAALLDDRRAMTPLAGGLAIPAVDTLPAEATRFRDALWGAGLAELFDPERSPLAMSGVVRAWVSELFHLTRASFVPTAPGAALGGAVALTVDRPFAWALRDVRHGAVLAFGRVFDPRE
jgi:hypothetical protein